MDQVLRELYDEHRNMATLLDALERHIAVHDAGETPDYELLEAIVDYFLEFPDHCHHPKEDLVLAKLRLHDPSAASAIGDLHADHAELASLTLQFSEGFDRLLEAGALPGGWFDQVAQQFMDFLRNHMLMEEQHFLPLADKVLTPADWTEIRAELTLSDIATLTSPERKRFATLSKEILALSGGRNGA